MYSGTFGYGVYKRNQVHIGNPYKIKPRKEESKIIEEAYEEAASAAPDPDEELAIAQDIIYKAKEEAATIKREAELEAEKILNAAKEEAELIKAETEQTAKEEGYRKGEELAQQHYNRLLAEAEEFKNRCKEEYEETIAGLEADIVELVLGIASKVVGEEIRNNKDVILNIVRDTIRSCSNPEHIVLKVSNEDYDYVVQNQEVLLSMSGDINTLEIKKDSSLTKGSCIVESGIGAVDGSADTRLENIKQAFYDIMGENGDNE